jgi:replicative DNA helicase
MPNLAVRAEQAVLGALLQNPDLIGQVGYLSGADFTDTSHKWIFDAIAETHAAHPEATGERLMALVADGAPEIDHAYLGSLPARCPVPGHLPAYGRMIAEASMIRELDVHAHRIARSAADLIRRRAGVGTPQQRSIPEHLARLAEAMIRHTRRLDPDRWPEVGPEPSAATQPSQLPEQPQSRREMEVLAGLLQHPAQCAQVLKWLQPRAFTPGPHREIYEALRTVALTGVPVDALTVAWQLCMRQAAEDTTGFGEKPSLSRGAEPAAAESVFRLAAIPVEPGSALLAGGLRLADHITANLPPDASPISPNAGHGPPGPGVANGVADPSPLPRAAQDPAHNGYQPRP